MNRYLEQIKSVEREARLLEPDAEGRAALSRAVFAYTQDFLGDIRTRPAFNTEGGNGRGLYDSPISEEPIDIDSALALVRDNVQTPRLCPASGGHLGYIPGGGIYPASLGDYLAAVGNEFAGIYFVSPGAVRMEHMLIRWMCDLVGYPDGAGGDLTSGGSIANLSAIVAARDAHALAGADFHRAVVYLTKQAHHSVDKALRIAGLGECVKRYVPMDEHYRMDARALDDAIATDRGDGLIPWLVIAAAGTTDTGAVDPLERIGGICEAHGLWFHVDAAYGGFFLLCEHGREMLAGIDKADSVVMDPHKGLFLPYGCGAVLVKDRKRLAGSQRYQANYLQDADEADDEYSPADHSPELTRHYRGMRLWLPLKLFGVAPFRACLEEKLLLARYFHEEIQKVDGFEAGPFPDLSVVTYRYDPPGADANALNERLIREVHRDGRVFITSTMLDGRFTLRLAVLCFRTHLDTVDTALEVLASKSRGLGWKPRG